MEKRLYSVNEVATMLGLSATSLRNKVAPSAARPFPIKPIRVGGAVRFDIRDIETYLQSQKDEYDALTSAKKRRKNGRARSVSDLPEETIG